MQEIQKEIYACQQQLQISEERLRYKPRHAAVALCCATSIVFMCFLRPCRLFEPDPAAFGSVGEVDGCEKFLMDMLTRVVERKVNIYMMSTNLSRFHLQDCNSSQIILSVQLSSCRTTC